VPKPALLLALLLVALPAAAEVYTYVDESGNRVFTDQPRSGSDAKRVELAPSNAMSAGPVAIRAEPPAAPAMAVPHYSLLRILVPEPDATIRDGDGNLIVTVTSEPNLLPGHNYRLYLDGKLVGAPTRSPVFPLATLDRGTHQLSVEIIDAGNVVLERTPSQPFHVQRPSLAQKRNVRPCLEADWGVRPECPLKDKPPKERDIPFIPFI